MCLNFETNAEHIYIFFYHIKKACEVEVEKKGNTINTDIH